MSFLAVGPIDLRVVEGSARELPPLIQGARTRLFNNALISTERDEKRVLECDIDLYSLLEETTLRAACPRGIGVLISGDFPGSDFVGTVDIGNAAPFAGDNEEGDPIWKTVSVRIEEA